MRSTRESFLQTVSRAVQQGNRVGLSATPPERGQVGYQGAGADLAAHFCEELRKAGGQAHLVQDRAAILSTVRHLLQGKPPRRVLLGRSPLLDALDLRANLNLPGVEFTSPETLNENGRDAFFAGDVGITGVDYLIAETGSIVLGCRPNAPRSFSLLPPVHIAVAERVGQILPDLFDLFAALKEHDKEALPSALTVITGPSKTGDIELRLVTGVHGPGEVHVVLLAS